LKSKFACGGTVKEGCIELQGDQKEAVKKTLRNMGYTMAGEE
jgi:translation initiation factor 1